MFNINDITRGLFGRAALMRRVATTPPPVPDPAPVFSAQPMAQVLYQENGAMRITGAAASPVTGWQWQKQNGDGSWSDVAGRTGQTLNITTAVAVSGVYRVKAINGTASAVSNTVQVVSVYLTIQNDITPTDPALIKNTQTSYNWSVAAGDRYVGAFYRNTADDSSFTPAGATGARAVAVWASNNTAVAPVSKVSAAGQWQPKLTKGSAVVTASLGSLTTTLSITVN